MLEHIGQIKQREAYEKAWALSISCQPHKDERGQKATYREVEKIAESGGRVRKRSAFEVAGQDRDARIRMIGSAWGSAGEQWTKGHAREVEWLKSQGVTLDEAAEIFEAWWDEKVNAAGDEYASGTVEMGIGGDGSQAAAGNATADDAESPGSFPVINIDAGVNIDANLTGPTDPTHQPGEGVATD